MRLLIDTNRIIAALVKQSTTRTILFDDYFDFLTPDYTFSEINKHKEELRNKTGLSSEEFDLLLGVLFEHIEVVPKSEYNPQLEPCRNDVTDFGDVPYLAAAIARKTEGIWTHDQHFETQKKVKVYTNKHLLDLLQNR